MRQGHAPDAASKIYYSMFYAAQALLKSEGIDVAKHSAVESAFAGRALMMTKERTDRWTRQRITK